ncbi:stimulated by retinoic acid gene 6 protein-like [Bombina bombina]|uniref:stimulated by retinoic acid gene 6 protein-like n=1 Tax=Bombina bombina TaxID=8345 RepID=UPI00235A5DEE|nr:stimulated by retinoic acid gene 6 protein-like [Bombina bombina]
MPHNTKRHSKTPGQVQKTVRDHFTQPTKNRNEDLLEDQSDSESLGDGSQPDLTPQVRSQHLITEDTLKKMLANQTISITKEIQRNHAEFRKDISEIGDRVDSLERKQDDLATDHTNLTRSANWNLNSPMWRIGPAETTWSLPRNILADIPFREELRGDLIDLIQLNGNGQTADDTLWGAIKAVTRGYIIRKQARLRKLAGLSLAQAHCRLRLLESANRTNVTEALSSQISAVRSHISCLELRRTQENLTRLKQMFYYKGNRADTLLANKLRQRNSMSRIHQIFYNNQTHKLPSQIGDCFSDYYSKLYDLEGTEIEAPASTQQIREFLDSLNLPSLSTEQQESLTNPFTQLEVKQVIQRLKSLKAPGPDGFPAQFYKSYSQELVPLLLRFFNTARQGGSFKREFLEAEIIMIPKPNKDPSLCPNYRPISLINVDIKIYSKLIANRICKLLPTLVNPDQILITILLSYLQRRAKHKKSEDKVPIGNRFGFIVPVNFLNSYSNRWSYGAACGATATTVFLLFFNEYSNYFKFNAPPWAKVLVTLLCSLEVGVDYYPFFACLSTSHRVIGSVLGFSYALCWFCVQLADLFECQKMVNVSISIIFVPVPSLACCLFLMGKFLHTLVETGIAYYRSKEIQEEEEPLLPKHQINYVKNLLKHPLEGDGLDTQSRWKIYKWDPYFKFPTRMIVTSVLCLICLYNFVLVDLNVSPKAVRGLNKWIMGAVNLAHANQTKRILFLLKESWFYSTFPSIFTSVIYILLLLSCYRKQMKELYKGTSEFTCSNRPPVVLAACIRYTGNQIAYLLWGYFILHVLFFLISLLLTFCIILPIQEGNGLQILEALGYAVLGIALMVGVIIAQVIAAHFLFLQDKLYPTDQSKPLAINNRRGFQNFNYFFMFYSVIMGLGACLFRVILNVFLGSWLLARIDLPLFPRGYEGVDMGYNTWTGMLQVDLYHTHPVALSFCHLLIQDVAIRKQKSADVLPNNVRNQGRIKWHLAYTLINNPALIISRKQKNCCQSTFTSSQGALERLLISAVRTRYQKQIQTKNNIGTLSRAGSMEDENRI